MKPWIWGVTALLALLWTGLVALTHQVTGWLLGAVDGAALQGAADAVGGLALPPLPPPGSTPLTCSCRPTSSFRR